MAPRKQTLTLNGVTSMGKGISIVGGTVSPSAIDQPHNTDSFLPQEAAAGVQPQLSIKSQSRFSSLTLATTTKKAYVYDMQHC